LLSKSQQHHNHEGMQINIIDVAPIESLQKGFGNYRDGNPTKDPTAG